MAVDGADRDPGALGDGGNGGFAVATAGDQLTGGGDYAPARLGAARFGAGRLPISHIRSESLFISSGKSGSPRRAQADAASGSGSGLITTVSTTSRTSSAGMPTRSACLRTASGPLAS